MSARLRKRILAGLLLAISVHSEGADQFGNRLVGASSLGGTDRVSLPREVPAPDRHSFGMRKRMVNGRMWYFGDAIDWWNEEDYLLLQRETTIGDYKERVQAHERDRGQWANSMISGTVIQVVKEGVILRRRSVHTLLKNYPAARDIVVGKSIGAIAMTVEKYEYTLSDGSKETIDAFDCGTSPAAKKEEVAAPLK